MFQGTRTPQEFSKDEVLCAVAEFVVCDDQSLAVVNKASFRNCLVAMRPAATKVDIPSMHNVTNYIHNSFVKFFAKFKLDMQVRIVCICGQCHTTLAEADYHI
ncbi:hypothetical protein EV702DRAFT_967569 [Suillus placidus]|uniref:Uncharacterized protein n=1 Tax=Suillus placidus TaxID=48579 RepID=A0A9P6ZZA5_9AGAM|nr:hypothetical protein EV702DRAFT_967569 [Suillus placidus]